MDNDTSISGYCDGSGNKGMAPAANLAIMACEMVMVPRQHIDRLCIVLSAIVQTSQKR